jgi:hypothetical protein
MKNILKIIAVFMLPLLVVTSCVDEDKLFELSDFENGAIPNLVQTANDDGFINLNDLNGTVLEFTVDFSVNFEQDATGQGGSGRENTSLEWADVASFDLELTYTSAVTGEIETGVIGNFTSWPVTMTLGADDLVAAISSLNSQADFNLADQFVFVAGVNLTDGTRLPAFVEDPNGNPVPGYSVNFNGAGNSPGINFSLAYNVACPSDLAGNYTATLVSSNIGAANFRSPQPVAITGGNGQYILSDGTMDIFGPDFPIGLAFAELCGGISVTAGSVDFPAQVIYDQGPGTGLDTSTGIITFDLTYNAGSCCGLAGIQYTFTVTPN